MDRHCMKIRNWDKWQTYRSDRGTPPWIKVHRNLMSNEDWAFLSDSEKGQLVSIWILAADKSGVIPDSPDMIKKMCMLDDAPNLNKFIELGFFESSGCHGDAKVTPSSRQPDVPETETETETETDKPKAKRFTAPTHDEVLAYMTERGFNSKTETEKFIDFYSSKGWMVGKNKMKDWKAAIRNWLKGVEQMPEPTKDVEQRSKVLDRYKQDLERFKV